MTVRVHKQLLEPMRNARKQIDRRYHDSVSFRVRVATLYTLGSHAMINMLRTNIKAEIVDRAKEQRRQKRHKP